MKLLAMKLSSLLACVLGAALIAVVAGVVQPERLPELYATYVPPQVQEQLTLIGAEYIVAVVLIVFGLYGFLPKLPSKKSKRTIAFSGDHGDVIVHLDMVESTITRVLSNMPEVKKINVRVETDGRGNKAKIVADCVLHDRPEIPARQAADAVNEYLADAAGNILGVEDIQSVKLNIVGVEVDAKKSSLYLESEHATRMKALEAKRLAPAPGLLAGADPLPEEPMEAPIAASGKPEPFAGVPDAEPVEDTSNMNNPMPFVPSQNDNDDSTFEITPPEAEDDGDSEEEKKPGEEA